MSLTIDQILAESRGEVSSSPDTFGIEKEAAAQPSVSSTNDISNEEIEKMAGLLREADLSEKTASEVITVSVGSSMAEKVAEALILSQTIQAIGSDDESEVKVASFRDKAIQAGYNANEVDALLEKEAKMNMMGALKSPIGKGIAATMALTGTGAIGHEIGESRTEDKANKAIRVVGRQAYSAGAQRGHRVGIVKGFSAGAQAQRERYKRRLREMRQGKVKK